MGGDGVEPAAGMVRYAIAHLEARDGWIGAPEMRKLSPVEAILNAPDDVRRACILELAASAARDEHRCAYGACDVLALAARKRLELSPADARALLDLVAEAGRLEVNGPWRASRLLKAVIRRVEAAAEGWEAEDVEALAPVVEAAATAVDDHALGARLGKLVNTGGGLPLELIATADDFGPRARAVLEASAEDAGVLAELLELLAGLPANGKPARKWLAAADAAKGKLADPARLVNDLIGAILDAGDIEVTHENAYYDRPYTTTHFFHYQTGNEMLAVGLVKLAAGLPEPELLPRLRRLAVKSVTVIGGEFGSPRSLKLANAAAQAIADMGLPGSITELLALERFVRHGTLLKQIRKAVDTLAAAQGMTREELLERAVETHDLAPGGSRDVPLSTGTARVQAGARGATLAYVDPDGKPRKSFPAAVKEADAETLAGLRTQLKGIRKTIAGERHRLDSLLALDRRWSFADWRSLYLDHPITGRTARELIWGFRAPGGTDVVAIPLDAGSARTSDGATVEIPADAEVRLWHPIHAPADDVRAWRQHLLDAQTPQPVKQAYRETYVLTPAEAETREYSNRFAGHVFGQVQARALMKGRRWSPVPVAWWDDGIDHGVARRVFDPFGVRAELYFDPIHDIQGSGDLYPYCTSDQVRFLDDASDQPLPLADVPLLVFTEAMRDVDLFIGVTSIGADPRWLDRGEGRQFDTYWNEFSFGELNASAEIRREVVAELLPRLAIADRCELQGRYLVVRGDLRTYRIHLGSGNILMSPNDQYLCIVAARDGRADKLFLPFDDDPVLSVVLSKAFMLADDTRIKDETIVSQISSR